ncbi:4-hydroxy-4-methyl-2-oxoglutarate aldolase [Glutamicibacter uratoxydans]|uniref:4-hydroxy-4-methyl-2-oxoglutarate aldolase n=1 Tax=Glutamicibacter uratoxydans TaxID=43667 RepID=A0A4Y4DN13_GLUUR|nr:ribonuclease E activity regulator RraA [Glutamicibacter uratoxydans]GED05000.1 4-hydroxy-4-methyl-2-oxoglutarate aldolase [Glutamicibacter uratoxydans]
MQQDPISTADLYDQYGDQLQSISIQFQDFGGRLSFHGPARTIKCHEDNGLVKETLSFPGNGAVLVVDGGGSLRYALMGDMIAANAEANGWAGVLIYGVVRDRTALAELQLGIKALGSNPRKTVKRGHGVVDEVITIGDVQIRPGAMVYADLDGVLVER